jgi:hypothetical protein
MVLPLNVTFWGSPTGVEADFIKLADYIAGHRNWNIRLHHLVVQKKRANAINDADNFSVSNLFP